MAKMTVGNCYAIKGTSDTFAICTSTSPIKFMYAKETLPGDRRGSGVIVSLKLCVLANAEVNTSTVLTKTTSNGEKFPFKLSARQVAALLRAKQLPNVFIVQYPSKDKLNSMVLWNYKSYLKETYHVTDFFIDRLGDLLMDLRSEGHAKVGLESFRINFGDIYSKKVMDEVIAWAKSRVANFD